MNRKVASPVNVASSVGVGSSVLQEQVDLGSIDRMISDAQVSCCRDISETSMGASLL